MSSRAPELSPSALPSPEPSLPASPQALPTPMAVIPARVDRTTSESRGPVASFASELEVLRRRRLGATAAFLAGNYGLVATWIFLSNNSGTLTVDGGRLSIRMMLCALRCLIATVVAVGMARWIPHSRRATRAVEYGLFLGITLSYMASEYFVGLDLLRRGRSSIPIFLAFDKNIVIELLVLMILYGTLIPNRASVAARMLVVMFAGPVIVRYLLLHHSDLGPVHEELMQAEDLLVNPMFQAIGMAMAIHGSFLTNGLRNELHRARKLGQYRLIRKLGEGGMGEVYLAEHQLLKRPCALKRIKADAGSDPIALARFEREVQSAARLAHPNIIEIYDYGRADDGTFYYVMEYLRGLSLLELVRKAGPLPPGRAIYLFRQVCSGLAEAHALGLVHRDMKPANVLVAVRGGESDVAKVLDFGIVKLMQDPDAASLTIDESVRGTPMYMAPEQATGDRSLDARADIYALGAMMYFTLTGRPPFEGGGPIAVMLAHLRQPVVPPSQLRDGLPDDLEQIILRCLAKDPVDRFPTVNALGEALAECQSASEWGPNRACAWWAVELQATPSDPQPSVPVTHPICKASNDDPARTVGTYQPASSRRRTRLAWARR